MKSIAFEKVSIADAKRVHDGAPRPSPGPEPWVRRSSAPQDEPLRDATATWMDEMAVAAQPLQLASRFPRIANRICALWADPIPCAKYLADLLIVTRNNRQGFPAIVAREIGKLTAQYALLHPGGRAWA